MESIKLIYNGEETQLLKQNVVYETNVVIKDGAIEVHIDSVVYYYTYLSEFDKNWGIMLIEK